MMSNKLSCLTRKICDFSNEYQLKTKIGEGTFSEVWSCVHRNDGQDLAAKILKKNYGAKIDAATWHTISEVSVTTSLGNHPSLLMVMCAYHEPDTGRVILVTELMKKSLFDIIGDGKHPLPDNRIKIYMYQMLEGLKYLHENGFIHRDIKPENILLKCRDTVLKIGDFGTACHKSDGQPYAEYVATRWYRSPECLLTRGWYTTKLDVWSAGCVLFEIGTGRPLFSGDDADDQLEKIEVLLGSPTAGLVEKLKKHKSDVFVKRFGTGSRATNVPGVGLYSVYQPYRPAYELLKDMIVYDPAKRFSADRLLRKPYFYDMKNTQHECRIRRFYASGDKLYIEPVGEDRLRPMKNKHSFVNKKQGPGGDRVLNLPMNTVLDVRVDPSGNKDSDNTSLDSQNQKPHKIFLKDHTSKYVPNQGSNNFQRENRNESVRNARSTVNVINSIQTINSLTNSVSTTNRISTKLRNNNSMINRPPFR